MQQYTVYLYLQTALHVSSGISTRHQELISLYLQHLALIPLLPPVVNVTGWEVSSHPVTFTTGSSNGINSARYCRYSDMSSWWWLEIPPETCWAVCRHKLYIVASCWILIDTYYTMHGPLNIKLAASCFCCCLLFLLLFFVVVVVVVLQNV